VRFILQNWSTKKIIYISISLWLAYIGLIEIHQLNLYLFISFLIPIIGLICLTLLPGILILGILKIHSIEPIEYFFYSIGLSIAFIMFTSLLINILLPLMHIVKPITILPLSVTYILLIFLLCILYYNRDKDYKSTLSRNKISLFKDIISPVNLFLFLIPLLTTLGSMIIPVYHNITFSVISIMLIILIMSVVTYKKGFNEKYFYLLIYVISIALLLHTTMASSYPMRINVDYEYIYQNIVQQSGFWNIALPNNANTALSITLLSPVFTLMLGLNSYIIFQVIYPILFAIVPLMLYHIYSRQIGHIYGLLTTFFFISYNYFYYEAPLLRRQEIGCIFLVLIILLLVDEKLDGWKKIFLGTVFSLSLFVAHYATGYIFLGMLLLLWLIIASINYCVKQKKFEGLKIVLKKIRIEIKTDTMIKYSFITGTYVLLNIVFALLWYMYVGSGSPFVSIVQIGNGIIKNITDFFDPSVQGGVTSALGAGFFSAPYIGKIYRIIQYLTQALIIIGLVRSINNKKGLKTRYLVLSSVAIIILILFMVLPIVSISISTERMYFILLIILSPYCILGGEYIFIVIINLINKFKKKLIIYNNVKFQKIYFTFLIVPYFAFYIGLVFLIMGYTQKDINIIPSSAVLSYTNIDTGYYSKQEVIVAQELPKIVDYNDIVYADHYFGTDLINAWHQNSEDIPSDLKINTNEYIFLRKWDIDKNEIIVSEWQHSREYYKYINMKDIPDKLNPIKDGNKIYSNGNADLYKG